MYAVAALLDTHHDTIVRELWEELHARFDVHSPFLHPVAHISFQVGWHYNIARLTRHLQRIAKSQSPFTVRTTGLGLFPGITPVLHIPVVRSKEMAKLHNRILQMRHESAVELSDYYLPNRWFPHITLVQADHQRANFAEMIQSLCEREFYWEIEIDHLVVMAGFECDQAVQYRFDFGAK